MTVKTILITGSTDGIGKIAAINLAKENHHVILHGRNPEKLSKVIDEVKLLSRNQNVLGYKADLSNLDEVRNMAKRIKGEHQKIDFLVNNAGIFKTANPITKDGMDIRLVVNYLAPYLLTQELLPLLRAADGSRVINLSSAAQDSVSLDFKSNISLSDNVAYAQSKLAILMWSFHMAKLYPEINTIALNPGSLLNTKMVQEAYGRYWSSADKGADIIVDLAIKEKYKNASGSYFDNDKGDFGKAHPDAYEENLISELVKATENILKEV